MLNDNVNDIEKLRNDHANEVVKYSMAMLMTWTTLLNDHANELSLPY